MSPDKHNSRITRIVSGRRAPPEELLAHPAFGSMEAGQLSKDSVPYETLRYGDAAALGGSREQVSGCCAEQDEQGPRPTEVGCLGNLFVAYGEKMKPRGVVLKVEARKRLKGERVFSLTEHMRRVLSAGSAAALGEDSVVGLGGVFAVKQGSVLGHVMPEFLEEQ